MDSGVPETSSSTSLSLLERARACDPEAWQRLTRLYGPMVYSWARRAGLQASDVADVGQEVFCTVARRIDEFRRDRPGDSFRSWLRSITRKKLQEFYRRRNNSPQAFGGTEANQQLQVIAELPRDETLDPNPDEAASVLIHRVLELLRVEFEEKTWRAFWRVTIDGQKGMDVAEELQMTHAAVRQAKCRVLRRLKQELADLA